MSATTSGTTGGTIIGGVRFISPEQAEIERGSGPKAAEGKRGWVTIRDTKASVSSDDVLLDWKDIAIEIYGASEGARKTWDAVDHLWHVGLSDRRGGVIKLEFVESPRGRRSTVKQCRDFLKRLADARTAARSMRAVKCRRAGTQAEAADLAQAGRLCHCEPAAHQLTDEDHQLGSTGGLSPSPR